MLECESLSQQVGPWATTTALAGAAIGIGNVFCAVRHDVERNPELDIQYGVRSRPVDLRLYIRAVNRIQSMRTERSKFRSRAKLSN